MPFEEQPSSTWWCRVMPYAAGLVLACGAFLFLGWGLEHYWAPRLLRSNRISSWVVVAVNLFNLLFQLYARRARRRKARS